VIVAEYKPIFWPWIRDYCAILSKFW
jgi:hypothetical protein